jgi:hypothetical protein
VQGAAAADLVFRPLNRHGAVLAARLSDKAVARIVKRAITATGANPALYAGHSHRAGLAAALGGASERSISSRPATARSLSSGAISATGRSSQENAVAKTGL